MSRHRSILGLPLVALTLTACADKPAGPPFDMAAHHSAPADKKPVVNNDRDKVSTITLEEFFQLHESGKALVIDARPSFVYQFGNIPGAINLPKKSCAETIAKREVELRSAIAAGKTIVVYCTGLSCPDAHTVAHQLAGSGIPSSVFTGGWDAWQEAGMPVE